VNVIEAGKVNAHAVFLKFASGQLPFLGLIAVCARSVWATGRFDMEMALFRRD
jgi:hypothetical protein